MAKKEKKSVSLEAGLWNACNKLSYADIKPFTNETRLNLETFHNKIKRGKEGVVEEALENHNDGKRFRELLKEFK